MKKKVLNVHSITVLIIIIASGLHSLAQEKVIYYSGTRLTYPLVEAWGKEFTKSHPDISLKLIPRGDTTKKADLKILAYKLTEKSLAPEESYTIVANYTQLPITNSNNPQLKEWKKKGFTKEELKNLYFNSKKQTNEATPTHHTVNLYTREKPACTTRAFASHYGVDVNQSKGIGVEGDDFTLLQAVINDTNGVSYNNLGFIYDLKTNKVVSGISIIPIDFNENNKVDEDENIYENLSDLLIKLETGNLQDIAIDNVNFVYEYNENVKTFLEWVLNEGQEINHKYGFLKAKNTPELLILNK